MNPRLLIAAGGTGGHIFPALALANELKKNHHCSLLFSAGRLSKNPYFPHHDFNFFDVSCSNSLLRGFRSNAKGVYEAIKIMQSYKPQAVIGFGSYYTFPILIGAFLLRIPILLHESNSIPGRVNRLFSPVAKKTWISFLEAKKQLRGEVEICKMPLREQFKKDLISKEEACFYFNLNPNFPVLLVFGGSQGAEGINHFFSNDFLSKLKLRVSCLQVIHFTGNKEESLSERYKSYGISSYVKAFENRMDLAWAAADIAVSRAGGSSIAEQTEFEVPGILIPFPGALDDHQNYNANDLVQAGLCQKFQEKELDSHKLLEALWNLLQTRDERKALFHEKKKKAAQKDLSLHIIEWLQAYERKRQTWKNTI